MYFLPSRCDAELGHLGSISYAGGSMQNILNHQKYLSRPFGVVFFKDYVYWIDTAFNGGSISR